MELPVSVVSGGNTIVMVSFVAKILAVVNVTTKSKFLLMVPAWIDVILKKLGSIDAIDIELRLSWLPDCSYDTTERVSAISVVGHETIPMMVMKRDPL